MLFWVREHVKIQVRGVSLIMSIPQTVQVLNKLSAKLGQWRWVRRAFQQLLQEGAIPHTPNESVALL